MKRFLVLLFLIVSSISYSQSFNVSSLINEQTKNGSIKGIVIDNEVGNNPLAFATIEVKGTNLSTTSELDGSFSFNLKPGNYTLIYSFIGYKTTEAAVEVASSKTINCNQELSFLSPELNILVAELK